MPEIISRKEATALGLKRYFTGKPCKHGHVCERFVLNWQCIICQRGKVRLWRRNLTGDRLEKRRKYDCEKVKKWLASDPSHREKYRKYQREYQRKKLDLIAVLRKEMPELLKEFGL